MPPPQPVRPDRQSSHQADPWLTKHKMLWLVGATVLAFTYIAAVDVKQYGASFGAGGYTYCTGLWDPTKWFSSSCSDSLPQRLSVVAIGVIALLICGYFAEKQVGRSPTAAHMSRPPSSPKAANPAPTMASATAAPVRQEFKTCPDCAEEIRAAARKCRFCGYSFGNPGTV